MILAARLAVVLGAWLVVLGVGATVLGAARREQRDASAVGLTLTFVLAVVAVVVTMVELGIIRH